MRGDVSSQFLSALLMALPLRTARRRAIAVEVDGELISRPYVEITHQPDGALRRRRRRATAGDVSRAGRRRAIASPGTIAVEGDASSASYFLAAGAIGGGPVRVEGVGRDSIQGDVRFADVLARMGADVRYGDDWIEARAGAPLAGDRRSTASRFPTPR